MVKMLVEYRKIAKFSIIYQQILWCTSGDKIVAQYQFVRFIGADFCHRNELIKRVNHQSILSNIVANFATERRF